METFTIILAAIILCGFAWFLLQAWRAGVRQSDEAKQEERREMGRCANCGYDLRGGHVQCPECGHQITDEVEDPTRISTARLSSEWPDAPIEPVAPGTGEELVQIHSTEDGWEADLITQQFEARGVWCVLRAKETTEVLGAVSRTVNYYRIVVAQSECGRASAILDRFRGRSGS